MALPTATRAVTVDAPRDDDVVEIQRLFDDTVLLGAPSSTSLAGFDAYRALCLAWYLDEGRDDAGVARIDGEVSGYALVCTDQRAASRHERRAALTLARQLGALAARRQVDAASRAFYRLRLRDARTLARDHRRPPAAVHAHLNVRAGRRSGSTTLALVEHIDRRCRFAGERRWYGEMNERRGRRSRALARLGFEIVDAAPNYTLSTLLGTDVDRLTVLRSLD
ncbi:MAG: hypothetical protein AAFY28_02910 [Actinomycetota bacterium]